MKLSTTSVLLFIALVVLYHLHRTLCIPLEQFYPYGKENGDMILAANDDQSSSPITLTVPFPFFDEEKHIVFVSKACVSSGGYSLSPLNSWQKACVSHNSRLPKRPLTYSELLYQCVAVGCMLKER